jgi:hypothetical protein
MVIVSRKEALLELLYSANHSRDQPERFDRRKQGLCAIDGTKLNHHPSFVRVGLGRDPIGRPIPGTGFPSVLYGMAWKEMGLVHHLGHSRHCELIPSNCPAHFSDDSLECSHRVFGFQLGDVAGC